MQIAVLLLGCFAVLCNAKPTYSSDEENSNPFHENNFSAEIKEHEELISKTEKLSDLLPNKVSRDLVDQSNIHNVERTKYDGEGVTGSRQKRALVFRPLFV